MDLISEQSAVIHQQAQNIIQAQQAVQTLSQEMEIVQDLMATIETMNKTIAEQRTTIQQQAAEIARVRVDVDNLNKLACEFQYQLSGVRKPCCSFYLTWICAAPHPSHYRFSENCILRGLFLFASQSEQNHPFFKNNVWSCPAL